MDIEFTWDPDKAAANERKHGVSFEDAARVFDDPDVVVVDDDLSDVDDRQQFLGYPYPKTSLLLVIAIEQTDVVRIISARHATSKERDFYTRWRGRP